MNGEQQANLTRPALAEVEAYPVVKPAGKWEAVLHESASRLAPEYRWALVRAVELLAAEPDRASGGRAVESQRAKSAS